MYHTTKDVFWKCWLWSIICSAVLVCIFWAICDLFNILHGKLGNTIFVDLLLGLSFIGSYVGAGFVGWRIVDNYYHDAVKRYLSRYKLYSVIGLILLIGIMYSPFPALALFWSILAPFCVVLAISDAKKPKKKTA